MPSKKKPNLTYNEALKLIQELKDQQIALELENEELKLAKEIAEQSIAKNTEFYDFAPSGYFTVSNKGFILGLNMSAANMLGKERELLINNDLEFYISVETKPVFKLFLDQIFKNKVKASCELILSTDENYPIYLNLTGSLADNEENCLIAAIDVTRRRRMEDAYKFLIQCGYQESNEDFFESLAKYLSQQLGMEYVCIDKLDGNGLTATTVAIYNEGKFETNVDYSLKETPCGEVVGKSICCFQNDVCRLFPNDKALQDLKAVSYIGTTLWSFDGKPIGLIAVIGQKPLKNKDLAESLLKIVSVRAAGEIERKKAGEELMQRELTMRKYIDFAPHGIFVANENGNYVDVNHAACKITGYNKDELLSMNLAQLIPVESTEDAVNHFKRVVDIGFATGEFPYLKKDKSVGYWFVDAVKLSNQRFLGFVVDVTRHKQAEEIIIENERLLRESQNVASIGSYATDLISMTWKASPEIYNIFGIDKNYPHTLDAWASLIHPNSRKQVANYMIEVEIEKKRFDFEYKIIRFNDGEERWVHGLGELEYELQNVNWPKNNLNNLMKNSKSG